MACPVCQHTMHNLGLDQAARRTWWCPRCGSLKTVNRDGYEEVSTPMIVERAEAYLCDKLERDKERLTACLHRGPTPEVRIT